VLPYKKKPGLFFHRENNPRPVFSLATHRCSPTKKSVVYFSAGKIIQGQCFLWPHIGAPLPKKAWFIFPQGK